MNLCVEGTNVHFVVLAKQIETVFFKRKTVNNLCFTREEIDVFVMICFFIHHCFAKTGDCRDFPRVIP